jgi:hypothetical protein
MQIGQRVLAKYNGKVREFRVVAVFKEDLTLSDEEITISAKYWEIRSVPNDWKKETD